jgi:hypothetical protein
MIHSGGNPTLTNVTFSGNTATQGGGMFNEEGGNVWLTNVTLSRNTATESGGGMVNFGRASLRHVTFSGNSTKGGSGGGMVNEGGESTLVNVIFSGNSATGDGGGMVMVNTGSWSDPAMLVNVTFSGNSATGDGGGMMVMVNKVGWVYDATLVNVIFSGNAATEGGGMVNREYNMTLVNTTFSRNTATESGGGMTNTAYFTTLTNCILWGNQAPSGPQIFNASGYLIVRHSLVQDLPDEYSGQGNLSDDPLFADADGPDDEVGTPDDDLRLELTSPDISPAIDAGDSSALPADTLDLDGDGNTTEQVPLDLNGHPRFVDVPDKPNTGIGVVDMGACEALELRTIYLPLVLKNTP